MRYVVGYTANARGHDAVHLAVALARNHDVSLDLVLVIPEDSPFNAVYPPEAGYNHILNEQAQRWLDEGLDWFRRTSPPAPTSAAVIPKPRP
jgi:hypothetical protein